MRVLFGILLLGLAFFTAMTSCEIDQRLMNECKERGHFCMPDKSKQPQSRSGEKS